MTDVLVCIKRVPEISSEVRLTDDGLGIDARHVGYTISAHEAAAVEAAVRIAEGSGGTATAVTLGPAEAVEQLRDALAVGCGRAIHVEADSDRFGPADVAAALAELVRRGDREPDLVLLGNDASDTGDFQVGIRLAYLLGRPVLTGVTTVEVSDVAIEARGSGPDGDELYEAPLPAVVALMEGGVAPRYPSVIGRMRARKIAIEPFATSVDPVGPHRRSLVRPIEPEGAVRILGKGPEAAPAVVDVLAEIGVLR